ncbi:unnamed protein product, partial [Iphiclides podalirius]
MFGRCFSVAFRVNYGSCSTDSVIVELGVASVVLRHPSRRLEIGSITSATCHVPVAEFGCGKHARDRSPKRTIGKLAEGGYSCVPRHIACSETRAATLSARAVQLCGIRHRELIANERTLSASWCGAWSCPRAA